MSDGWGSETYVRLNGLLLHNRLDRLVDVVVHVLAGGDGLHGCGMLALDADRLVLELGSLLGEVVLVLLGRCPCLLPES
jgi:hypothetical protein